MSCAWWNTSGAPEAGKDNPRQVFGARSVLRSRLVAASAVAVLAMTISMIVSVVANVASENGPDGGLLMARNTAPTAGEALFDMGAGAPSPGHHSPYINTSELLPETAECQGASDNKPPDTEVYAFSSMDVEWLEMSLARSCHAVDVLMPNWFSLDGDGMRWTSPFLNVEDNPNHLFNAFRQSYALLPVVRLTGFSAENTHWQEPLWARDVVSDISAVIDRMQLRGVCIDLTTVPQAEVPRLEAFLWMAAQVFGDSGAEKCVIADPAVLSNLRDDQVALFDTVIVPSFDRGVAEGTVPRPMASQAWFEQLLADVLARVPQDRLVLMLGAGAYEWQMPAGRARKLDFVTAIQRVARRNGTIRFSEMQGNSFAMFLGADGQRYHSWVLDSASAYNQMRIAQRQGIRRLGLWGLGLEDPTVWQLFAAHRVSADLDIADVETVDLSGAVRYTGSGPFLDFQHRGRSGQRQISTADADGLITDVQFWELPLPFVVNRWGVSQDRVVSLTFDDGPTAEYTTAVLDILDSRGVSATFFPVGAHMIGESGLLHRIMDEGHTLGSHTFFHPDLTEISAGRLLAEVKAQSHVYGNLLGMRPVLFRAPYVRGPGPVRGAVAEQMLRVDAQGYIIAGSEIVPPDWTTEDPRAIADFVIAAVEAGQGQVILLHDGGGDRTATVAALPLIIDELRQRGYSFTDLAGLAGFSHHDFMTNVRRSPIPIEATLIVGLGWFVKHLPFILLTIIALRFTRGVILFGFALKRGRVQRRAHPRFRPEVTVVVPAYNEEKVIVRTLRSILASRYRKLSVLVVNDGSSDATEEVVRKAFRRNKRVRIVSQPNQGKWRAANRAIEDVTTDIVVMVDADTLVDPQAIGFLVQSMADPAVGAVAGNVKVGNDKGALTRLQALEYTRAQNIDRRAFELVNGIMVVPGAIGAWRTEAIREAGFYSADTLTEDADLTVSVLRAGYDVRFDERAFTYTEAPETVMMFLQQRLRWTLGMIQTAWKHKRSGAAPGAIGRLVLPDFLIFGVLMPLLTPVVDLIVLWTLVGMLFDLLAGTPPSDQATSVWVLGCYIALPLLDIMMTATAIKLDGRARLWWLIYLPLQRLIYQPLLTLTLYRALWRAMTGRLAKWSKVTRAASVRAPFVPAVHAAVVARPLSHGVRGSRSQ